MLDEFLAALDAAIEFVNADVIESRQYGHWRPVERQAGWEENALALPTGLWRYALPVDEVRRCRRGGQVRVRTMSPFGFAHDYIFAAPDLYRFEGADLRVQFDPHLISCGAVLTLPRRFQEWPAGYVVAEAAECISTAPDVFASLGWLDNRDAARAVKRASRALVATSVAAFDPRRKEPARHTVAQGEAPREAVAAYVSGEAANVASDTDALEAIRRSRRKEALELDWAEAEAAAGIIA